MREELHFSFFNRRFLLAFILMFVCFCGMSVPEWIVSGDWGAEFRPSALQQSLIGVFFGGSMLLLPFVASFTCAPAQVDEIKSSVFQWKIVRSSLSRYAIRKIISAFLVGGTVVTLAFVTHACIWNCIAYPCDPIAHPYHEIGFMPECPYSKWYAICYGLPMYISIAGGIFFCAGTWAIVALCIAVWIPDRLLAVTIPACIYYLLSASVFRTLFGWELPHPATLYNDMITKESAVSSLCEYFIILFIAITIYIIGLRRKNA